MTAQDGFVHCFYKSCCTRSQRGTLTSDIASACSGLAQLVTCCIQIMQLADNTVLWYSSHHAVMLLALARPNPASQHNTVKTIPQQVSQDLRTVPYSQINLYGNKVTVECSHTSVLRDHLTSDCSSSKFTPHDQYIYCNRCNAKPVCQHAC